MDAIQTQQLCRRFGDFTAVHPLDLCVRAGEIYGFLGANGAGKTTAMRMLCGLLQPSSGQGQVAGFDIATQAKHLRNRIGYMAQKFALYPDFSLRENLGLYGGLYGLRGKILREAIAESAQRLDLGDLLERNTGGLPWGWQQRLSLGCATLHRPAVLFLDEPTGSVDPLYRRKFWDLIHGFAEEGTTVFVTTHYLDEAEYCHRVGLMDRGHLIAEGSPRELKQQFHADNLHQVFLSAIGQGAKP